MNRIEKKPITPPSISPNRAEEAPQNPAPSTPPSSTYPQHQHREEQRPSLTKTHQNSQKSPSPSLNSPRPRKGKPPHPDCTVKEQILNAIKSGFETTSDIRIFAPDVPYGSLRTSLNRYRKQGYIRQRVGIKKPYRYELTPLGEEHAINPFLHRENFKKKMQGYINNRFDEEIAELLQDPATIERLAINHPYETQTIYRTLTEHIPTPVRDKILTDAGAAYTPPSIAKSSREIQLEDEVLRLRQVLTSQGRQAEQQEIPQTSPNSQISTNKRARYEIMKKYTDKQIFAKFFDFPEVPYYPYRVIASSSISELAKKKFKKGEVIVLDDRTAAKMVEMGHIKRLTAKEINKYQFILRHLPEGFYVRSTTFYIEKCIFDSKDIPREKEKVMSIAPSEKKS